MIQTKYFSVRIMTRLIYGLFRYSRFGGYARSIANYKYNFRVQGLATLPISEDVLYEAGINNVVHYSNHEEGAMCSHACSSSYDWPRPP